MRATIFSAKGLVFVCFMMLALGIFAGAEESVAAEAYPSRPIEVIVPFGPGGGADQLARKAAALMEPTLKVSLPVINAPGATGQTAFVKLFSQPADGYMIKVLTGDTYALFATGKTKLKKSDFQTLAIMIQQPSAFFVKNDSPWKTWADVEAAAKTKALKVATTGFDSPDDLTITYLKSRGINLHTVPYAKPGERYTSILGNHCDLLYEQAGDVKTFIDTKQMRPILFFADKRVSYFPNVQTSKELGYDVTLPQFRAIIVKNGTDAKQLKILGDAVAKAAASKEFKAYLKDQLADENSFVPLKNAQSYMDAWTAEANKVMAASKKKAAAK